MSHIFTNEGWVPGTPSVYVEDQWRSASQWVYTNEEWVATAGGEIEWDGYYKVLVGYNSTEVFIGYDSTAPFGEIDPERWSPADPETVGNVEVFSVNLNNGSAFFQSTLDEQWFGEAVIQVYLSDGTTTIQEQFWWRSNAYREPSGGVNSQFSDFLVANVGNEIQLWIDQAPPLNKS